MTPSTAVSSPSPAAAQAELVSNDDDIIWPPSDLYSDEPPLETTLHLQQMLLLLACLNWVWREREDYFAAGNLTVYYSPNKRKDREFRGPDFFVALDTKPHPRKSWMVWEEEGKYPNVIVELLSDSTAEVDRTFKKTLYAETFRTPEYFWFDPEPESLEFQGFALLRGQYQPIEPNEAGLLWSEQLQLYLGVYEQQLRFFEADGSLVPTPDEAAVVAEAAAAEAVAKANEAVAKANEAEAALHLEQQRAEKLAAKLKELGIEPDDL